VEVTVAQRAPPHPDSRATTHSHPLRAGPSVWQGELRAQQTEASARLTASALARAIALPSPARIKPRLSCAKQRRRHLKSLRLSGTTPPLAPLIPYSTAHHARSLCAIFITTHRAVRQTSFSVLLVTSAFANSSTPASPIWLL